MQNYIRNSLQNNVEDNSANEKNFNNFKPPNNLKNNKIDYKNKFSIKNKENSSDFANSDENSFLLNNIKPSLTNLEDKKIIREEKKKTILKSILKKKNKNNFKKNVNFESKVEIIEVESWKLFNVDVTDNPIFQSKSKCCECIIF